MLVTAAALQLGLLQHTSLCVGLRVGMHAGYRTKAATGCAGATDSVPDRSFVMYFSFPACFFCRVHPYRAEIIARSKALVDAAPQRKFSPEETMTPHGGLPQLPQAPVAAAADGSGVDAVAADAAGQQQQPAAA